MPKRVLKSFIPAVVMALVGALLYAWGAWLDMDFGSTFLQLGGAALILAAVLVALVTTVILIFTRQPPPHR